ncbi:MAG TPA: Gfo/Idh/MocA family oxidoreductase [Desulfosporosinus sp.]|nr:Gfo/Idh/MocA family oxidoreductase [Desulfosporosinus sp.]
MSHKSVYNVAIVGMGFGIEFIPIYQRHSNSNLVAICQRNQDNLARLGKIWGIQKLYNDYGKILGDKDIDIVHINLHSAASAGGTNSNEKMVCSLNHLVKINLRGRYTTKHG